MTFLENLFVCWAIVSVLVGGVMIIHGIGITILRLRDRRTGKKRFYVVRRVL